MASKVENLADNLHDTEETEGVYIDYSSGERFSATTKSRGLEV